MRKVPIYPLGRTVSAVGSRFIGDTESSDSQDVRTGMGFIENRYGWKGVKPKQSGFVAGYNLSYLRGIDSANATVKEYVSIENVSGTVKPWRRHATTGDVTEITKSGPTSVSLNASEWRSARWQDRQFFWNNSDATYALAEYTLGDTDSWLARGNPEPPTVALVLDGVKNTSDNTTKNYREIKFTGVHVTNDIAFTGLASAATVNADGSLTILNNGGGGGNTASVTITLNGAAGPGLQDLSLNDVFYLTVENTDVNPAMFAWNPESLKASVVNNDGTPDTALLVAVARDGSGEKGGGVAQFMFKYPLGYDRTLKDNSRKIKLEYSVLSRGSLLALQNNLRFSPVEVGCIDPEFWGFTGASTKVFFSYYWKESTTGEVSGLRFPLLGPFVPSSFDGEARNIGGKDYHMGLAPRLTATGGALTDKWVLVARRDDDPAKGRQPDGPLRITAEYADSALSQYYQDSLTDHTARSLLLDLDVNAGLDEDKILCAVAHRGHMVWGMKGGKSNIQHSAVGTPLFVFREDMVLFDDDTLPANFTMSDDRSENPVQMHSVGESLIILGENGVYAQSGDLPKLMTFIKRVGSLPGTAGFNASTVFSSDDGQEGVAYLSSDLETLLFVPAAPIAQGVYAYPPIIINEVRRPEFKAHLFGTTAPTASEIYVRYDPVGNSLWVFYHDKAFEMRLVNGARVWEKYDYSDMDGHFQWLSFSEDYGIRAARSTGEFDEIAYDNSDNKAGIAGPLRDNGLPVNGYWKGKTFTGENTRIGNVHVDRDSLADQPTITVASTRKTDSKQVPSGSKRVRFGPDQQGTEHSLRVDLTDDSKPVHGIIFELSPAGRRTDL